MKLNKKFMSLFAALLVSAGFLAACGNDNNDADDNNEVDTQEEADAEVVSAASVSDNPQHLVEMLTNDGSWMFAATTDMELEEDLVIQGEHHRRNDSENPLARKLALYASSREEVNGETVTTITDEFTLTVPNIIVKSPNVLLQLGTVVGNVIVEAEGFHLSGTTITGDLIFASQEYMDSASFESGVEGYDYEVQGEIRVAE